MRKKEEDDDDILLNCPNILAGNGSSAKFTVTLTVSSFFIYSLSV